MHNNNDNKIHAKDKLPPYISSYISRVSFLTFSLSFISDRDRALGWVDIARARDDCICVRGYCAGNCSPLATAQATSGWRATGASTLARWGDRGGHWGFGIRVVLSDTDSVLHHGARRDLGS